jgi:hypothetical protein
MNNSIDYLDKIVKILEVPYFYEMRNYGIIDNEEENYILRKIYGFEIIISTIYKSIENQDGSEIYWEDSQGWWFIKEYDFKDKQIYYEDCDGLIIGNR